MKRREPIVAGTFYLSDPIELQRNVAQLIDSQSQSLQGKPRFLVCPHAGYQYSGKVQAAAMKELMGHTYEKIILLGPSHHFAFSGAVASGAEEWETPMGTTKLLDLDLGFPINDHYHQPEHSLEVQLPFLQELQPGTPISPLLLSGRMEQAEAIAQSLVNEGDALFVISSDFHHVGPRFGYLPQDYGFTSGETMDRELIELILQGDLKEVQFFLKRYQSTVCGALPILVAMHLLQVWGLGAFQLKSYDCSQNMVGGADSVGYAALAA